MAGRLANNDACVKGIRPRPWLVLTAVCTVIGLAACENPVLTSGSATRDREGLHEVVPDQTGADTGVNSREFIRDLSIPEIQGEGHESPHVRTNVRTTGVVTLVTADGRSFWMQDVAGDANPATSDGIYVYRGAQHGAVSAGDLVEVVGTVTEYSPWSRPADLPLTEIFPADEVAVLEKGVPLPAPVPIDRLPDRSIPEGAAHLESLEGMLVRVTGPVVGPTSRYGEFVMLPAGNATPGSGFLPPVSQVVLSIEGDGAVDYNPERIIVDDATLDSAVDVAPGDRVLTLVGVVHYHFGNYKIQPLHMRVRRTGRARSGRQPTARGSLRQSRAAFTVATFNVGNLFDLVDEPGKLDGGSTPSRAELETKLGKLTLAFADELGLPAVAVVQEVENQEILQALGDRVNASAGTDYEARSFETSDRRGIEVGFLFDRNRVTLADAFQLSGPDVDAAFGPASASPGREPIVGMFTWHGRTVTIVGNHFTSKGGDEPLYSVNWPPARESEVQRKLQATVVRGFVNTVLEADHDALIIVAGDLNDFQFAEPGEGPDHPVGILEGGTGDVRLTNLVNDVPFPDRFTFVYDGNSQVLDHVLVSPAVLACRPRTTIVHFNAGFPHSLEKDAGVAARCSDHDPVLVSVDLR